MKETGPTSLAARSFLPATAVLEMTYRCNHNCIFCSCPWFREDGSFDIREELSAAVWKEAITRLCAMGVVNFAFTGGEALLREDLFEIIDHAASCTAWHLETEHEALVERAGRPRLYLLSNGLLVDEAVVAFCKEREVILSMSLPGLSTFAGHTEQDTADHVLAMFRLCRETGLKTTANITVTRKNLPELEETISAALLAGAEQILLNRFLPGGRGLAHADALSLNRDELVTMLDTAEAVLETASRFGSLGTEVPRCAVDAKRYSRLTVSTRCSAALGFFVVGPSGYIRVCNHSERRLVHISNVEALKDDPYWKTFVFKEYLPAACGGCAWDSDCDGGCREAAHIVHGDVASPDMLFDPVLKKEYVL